ncbi:FAD-dependent monooxygenase [Aliidiomarina halalkaliphila]|uniref:FAD-dependent monooxygenase n=1 Tax=Aliidiomarina halalkaliphila TaxID=2593535 RepID=UPI00163DE002|nr:FAD-dependent monooxygenase [Aliidiomarina halalkaliphila]
MRHVDIAIAGGGLTGCLAALVFARRFPELSIALLDHQQGATYQDPRGLALALRTQQVLAEYGIWNGALERSAAISHIHVSETEAPGSMEMHAERENLPALGYVAMAGVLQQALDERCAQVSKEHTLLRHERGVQIRQLVADDSGYTLNIEGMKDPLHCRLLVVAEGSNSSTRDLLGIEMTRSAYDQVAIAGVVTYQQKHQGWAFERFTPHGPAALLPQGNREAALVWCMQPEQAQHLMTLPEQEQLRAVQKVFGAAPGRLEKVMLQGKFPLQLALADRFIGHRAVVIGNACHTLHPVAGQGYNLGVRDILELAQQLDAKDPGAIPGLQAYRTQRQRDYAEIISLTHGLVNIFANPNPVLRHARSKALYTLRMCNLLSKPLMRKAMGFRSLFSSAGS